MPDTLNTINWDDFFARRDKAIQTVENEVDNYEATKKQYASPNDILLQRKTANTLSATNKTVNLQNQSAGNFMTGSDPSKVLHLTKTDDIHNHNQIIKSSVMQQDDPFKFAKPFDFNGTQYGQFFDRYYNHPKFKKLGFSPFRDNEAHYNANSTQWDDFNRMRTQWGSLFWDGYTGLFQNWGNFSLAGDQHHGANMEKAMGIAMSSKKGPGAFVTNLAGNSAYTFGILGEIATEEAALALISLIPGTQPITGAATARNIPRLLRVMKGVPQMLKGYRPLSGLVKGFTNLNQSRSFFNGVGKFGKASFKFLNPLENTFEFAKNADNLKNLDKLSDMAMVSKGFGSFYRDMRGINAAWDEATLEGGMVQNDLTNTLLNEYYKQNGHLPVAGSEDANRIYRQASEAGRLTSLANIPAIVYSNKIVFERPLRPLLKNTKLNISDVSRIKNWTFKEVKEAGKTMFVPVKKSVKNVATKNYWKELPLNVVKGNFKYLNANLTEGFQELYQEGLSAGMKKHYEAIYSNPQLAGTKQQWWHSFDQGVQSQMSSQGLDVFLSGALMGGLVQGPQKIAFEKIPQYSRQAWASKLFGKKGIERRNILNEQKKAEQDYINKLAESMSYVVNLSNEQKKQAFNLVHENTVNQRNIGLLIEDAMNRGDKKEAIDATVEGLALHLNTLAEGGKIGVFRDQITSMKGLSDQELEEMIGSDPTDKQGGKVRDRITKVEKQIDQYEKRLNEFDKIYGKQAIRDAVGAAAFTRAKRDFVYNTFALDNTLDRMQELLTLASNDKTLQQANPGDITVLLGNNNSQNTHLEYLKSQAKLGKMAESPAKVKAEGKRAEAQLEQLKGIRESIKELTTLQNDYANYKKSNNPQQSDAKAFTQKISATTADLRTKFGKYIKTIAAKSQEVPLQDNIDNLMDTVVDFHRLSKDQKDYTDTINFLSDPAHFANYQKTYEATLTEIFENRASLLKKGLESFYDLQKTNDLYNKLFHLGVFITPEGISQLEKGQMPVLYNIPVDYDSTTPDNVKDIDALIPITDDPKTKQKYADAMEVIHDYEIEKGITLEDKDLYTDYTKYTDDQGYVGKLEIDQRTLKDLYRLLGISSKDPFVTMKASVFIDKLFNSMFLGENNRALLNALKLLVSSTDQVSIVKNQNQAVSYNPSNFTLSIDLRYFANDYKQGKVNFELSAIKGLLMIPATREYSLDPEFSQKIDKLFEKAQTWFNTASQAQLDRLGYTNKKFPPYGLSSKEAFIAEAMANPTFQALLGNVTSGAVSTSIFRDFINAIKAQIKKFLVGDSTLLDEALDLITTKLFTGDISKAILNKEQMDKTTVRSHALYQPNLLVAYPTGKPLFNLLTEYKNSIPGEENTDLKVFIDASQGDPKIGQIINSYIDTLSNVVEPEPEVVDIIAQVTARLKELGYNETDVATILTLPEKEIANILDNSVPPAPEEVAAAEIVEPVIVNTVAKGLTNDQLYMMDGERGEFYLQGRQVVFETNSKIIELGDVDTVSDMDILEFNINPEQELDIMVDDSYAVIVNDKVYLNKYSNPLSAIDQDKDGNYSVTLDTPNGQKRTFRNQQADQIVYLMKLKSFEINATEQQIQRANTLADELIRSQEQALEPTSEPENKAPRRSRKRKQKTELKGPVNILVPTLRGKIVYATPGAGKTTLASLYPNMVIDGDVIMTNFFNDIFGTDVKPEDIGSAIIGRLDPGMEMDNFYDEVLGIYQDTLAENPDKVLLTGTSRFMDQSFYQTPPVTAILTLGHNDNLIEAINRRTAKRENESEKDFQVRKEKAIQKAIAVTRKRENSARRRVEYIYEIGDFNSNLSLENVLFGKTLPLSKAVLNERIFNDFVFEIGNTNSRNALDQIKKQIDSAWFAAKISDESRNKLDAMITGKTENKLNFGEDSDPKDIVINVNPNDVITNSSDITDDDIDDLDPNNCKT